MHCVDFQRLGILSNSIHRMDYMYAVARELKPQTLKIAVNIRFLKPYYIHSQA